MDDHRNLSTFPKPSKRKQTTNGDPHTDFDPVMEQTRKDIRDSLEPKGEKKKKKKPELPFVPSMNTRMELSVPEPYPVGVKYMPPHPKGFENISKKRREELETLRNFCKYTVTEVPSSTKIEKINIKLKVPSIAVTGDEKFPRQKRVTSSDIFPPPPSKKELRLHEPKSGTIINIKKKKRVIKRKKPKRKGPTIQELIARELATIQEMGEGEGEDELLPPADESDLTKKFRKKVAQLSKSTSYNQRDFTVLSDEEEGEGEEEEVEEEEVPEEEDHFISALAQKFRRESEIKRYEPPKRKTKKGTLENFSLTKLKQPTLKTFYYGIKMATIHQGDMHFPPASRNRQGICMPIAAYCFSVLKHPNKWIQSDIDDILEAGNELFLDSAGTQHMHSADIELRVQDLQKYCKLGNRKVRFTVSEPEVSGMVRSEDIKIYNLTKAINVFFGRYSAGILETDNMAVAMWKDKHYYFFDASPRTLDLFTNPRGVALMAHFYDTTSIISVLLNRSDLDNTPFVIYSISAYKVLRRDAEEVDSKEMIKDTDTYQVLNEEKAVASGSFDLADKCFGFSRNKQGLTIAAVALVYSKITPPNSWHKGTVDKILIIGNQLFLECIESEDTEEVNLDDLPAVFTIGPYVVEIYISPDRFVDFLYKKSKCVLEKSLEKFFETNSNAIVQIETSTLAIWKQRNVYHCFDPYSRNNEGFQCKNGAACVCMHTTIASLIATITNNFDDKDMIFHLHAMKVCKIHRDPSRNDLFPVNLTMNDFPAEKFKKLRMKRGKRKATTKKVTVDPETRAKIIGDQPDESILEVGSTVRSIDSEDVPSMIHKHHSKIKLLLSAAPGEDVVADLDSPSLSDTQIEPPGLEDGDVIEFMDLDAFDLTQEEVEMAVRGEGEGGEGGEDEEGGSGGPEGDEDEDKVRREMDLMAGQGEEGGWYMATSDFTQVGSHSLLSRLSEEMNTDFPIIEIPEEEVPSLVRNVAAIAKKMEQNKYQCEMIMEEPINVWDEYQKHSYFVNLPDNSQIILGTKNLTAFGDDPELLAPFASIMAIAVARKHFLTDWVWTFVDYVLDCGNLLYRTAKTRFDQNFKLEVERISLGSVDYTIKVDYVFDAYLKPGILSMALNKMLFPRCWAGIVVTPTYSCAVIRDNNIYYLFDGFGNNEVGLSKGPGKEGVACIARFMNLDHMVSRILHNKCKREKEENVEYNRFVISSCHVKHIPKEEEESPPEDDDDSQAQPEDGVVEEPVVVQTYKKPKPPEPKPKKSKKMGYHHVQGLSKIQGTKIIGGINNVSEDLKEDYFVCVCACLLLMNNPLKKWDSRKVDSALEEGVHVFNHAEDIDVCSKKYIKNVLIEDYIFDLIVQRVVFTTYKPRRTLKTGIETMMQRKAQNFIIQFPNRSYTLSVEPDVGIYHLFDPNDPSGKASWTRYKNFSKLVQRIKSGVLPGSGSYNFHSLEITSIGTAPKDVVRANRIKKYKQLKDKKLEMIGKPFHEDCRWLDVEPIPWSWRTNKTQLPRWNNWYVDFPDDLVSMFGTLSPLDEVFPIETRGRHTLGNLVVAIGMTQIYELCDWNDAIMDTILLSGNVFFQECIQDITDDNYEVAFEDIKKECKIFPYSFKVKFTPVVEGTMFLIRLKQFNLFKSLRLFFDDYERRYGIICVTKSERDKKLFAFGKIQDSEYFMYDCETLGPPMYIEKDVGVPYMLRTTTLNRLLHVMTLTLRGGDFYIFDVSLTEMKTIK